MASADDQVLGAFSLRRFLSDGMGRRLLDKRRDTEKFKEPDAIRSMKYGSFARFVESLGWLNAGMEIEYFATIEPLDPAFREAVIERFEREGESAAWPFDFKRVSRILFTQQESRFIAASDIDAKGFFQAALWAAESFDRPLVARLLSELRRPGNSPLDEPLEVEIEELYGALHSKQYRRPVAIFAAGWLQLVPVLQTFVDVFGLNLPSPPPLAPEVSLHDSLGSLMSWRLNLSSEKTNRRLTNLTNTAFHVMENVRRFNIASINWEIGETVSQWNALLTSWQLITGPAEFRRYAGPVIEEELAILDLEATLNDDGVTSVDDEEELDSSG